MELELFVFLFVSFFRGLSPLLTSGRCASLDIQRLDKNGSETSAENATIRVRCTIKSSCNKNDVFVILGKNEPNALRCAVTFANETCIPPRASSVASQSSCSCTADTVTTNFTQTASQSHSGQWYCSVPIEPSNETERITITFLSTKGTTSPPPTTLRSNLVSSPQVHHIAGTSPPPPPPPQPITTTDVSTMSSAETKLTEDENTQVILASSMPWVTAGAAVLTAVVVIGFAARLACRSRGGAKSRELKEVYATEAQQFRRLKQHSALRNSRLTHSEECVMIPNFLYQRTRSLPEIPDSVYQEVRDLSLVKLDIDNRPPAPLPRGAGESDYAEVNEQAIGGADANDYVPINEILERKGPELAEDTVCCSENIVDSADPFVTTDSP